MSYGIRKDFYNSKAWKIVRRNIWLKQNLLCAICNKPVYVDGISEYIPKAQRRAGIVHHKEHLNDINVYDDEIALNEENLIGVCKECHEKEHHKDIATRKGYSFNEYGELVNEASNRNVINL